MNRAPFESATSARTILVCTDASEASETAVQAAFTLARRWSSRIRLLQVLEFNPGFASQAIDYIQEWEQEAWEGLKPLLAQATVSELEAEAMVRRGEAVYRVILEEAEKRRPELIVMGRHGRAGLTRLLLGSATARLIGLSPVNVLVVPRNAPLSFRRLLAASDGSPYSQAAWREALNYAKAWSSELLAVSVAGEKRELPMVEEILTKMRLDGEKEGIPLTLLSLRGAPDEAIVQAALTHGADLLILGSHGRTGIRRLLMGSVTERVIGHASCPVLVVKMGKGEVGGEPVT